MGDVKSVYSKVDNRTLWLALHGSLRRVERDLVNMEPRRLPLNEVRMAIEIARELRLRGDQLKLV